MATTVYKSGDASAPVLTGAVGSLIGVLDACLVNGYGAKSAAGWSKAFTGTNLASYLGTAGHYLDVNDAAAGAGGAKEATVRGYEAMTAVGTGTAAFPTTSQVASPGMFIRKSVTADATARGWAVIADGLTFHLFILSADTANRYQSFSFGRFYSTKTSDTYRSCILGHETTGAASNGGLDSSSLTSTSSSGQTGAYTPRIAAGTGTAVNAGLSGFATAVYGSPYAGPNSNDGLVYLSRLFLTDAVAAGGLRGYVRGVYQIITATGMSDGDTFTGSGDFAGRTFLVLSRSVNGAFLALETSAWDSSA